MRNISQESDDRSLGDFLLRDPGVDHLALPRRRDLADAEQDLDGDAIDQGDEFLGAISVRHSLTPMLEQFIAAYAGESPDEQTIAQLQSAARRSLLGRAAEPDELAATVVHVVLDATAMTGAVVPVDLGYTAS